MIAQRARRGVGGRPRSWRGAGHSYLPPSTLRLRGKFAWNAFAFDYRVAARLDGQHQDKPVPHWVHYDIAANRIDLRLDDGGTSSLWTTKNEWLGLLDVAGLDLEALYGGFDRSPLNEHSREYIFVAVRQ